MGVRRREGLQSQASSEPLSQNADGNENEKDGGCYFFFSFYFFDVLLPFRSSNGQLQRHERDKQVNT